MRRSAVAALLTAAVLAGLEASWWSARGVAPEPHAAALSAPGAAAPAPSALAESGITSAESGQPAAILPPLRRPPVATARLPAGVERRRPAAARPSERLMREAQAGPRESRVSVDDRPAAGPASDSGSRAQTPARSAAAPAPAIAAAGDLDPDRRQQTPPQPAVSEPPPSAPMPAPAAFPPATVVLTPPVPVELTPPKHPQPYRMVVDAPGLASAARLEAVEARVRLRLVVRADGNVARVEIAASSGRAELDEAALDAARHWRFLPARRNGEPVDSVALIWVAFVVGP